MKATSTISNVQSKLISPRCLSGQGVAATFVGGTGDYCPEKCNINLRNSTLLRRKGNFAYMFRNFALNEKRPQISVRTEEKYLSVYDKIINNYWSY